MGSYYRGTKRSFTSTTSSSHHKNCHSRNLLTFSLGLLIGIVLSVGLRMLANQQECSQKIKNTSILVTLSSSQSINQDNKDNNDDDDDDETINSNRNHKVEIESDDNRYSNIKEIQDQIENLDDLLLQTNSVVNLPFSDFDTSQQQQSPPPRQQQQQTQERSTSLVGFNVNKIIPPKRNLILIGVMTAHKYLHTRAVGVFETWAKEIPGQVIFFTGADSSPNNENTSNSSSNITSSLPLVALPGVDDTYPPQKKSFQMLKHMYDHYGDQYEWFMRADDDVYIKADKLAEFLRSINSRQLYFIGQAGRGNSAEKGTLKLAHNENFCMGGPGIIFSRVALSKVAPFVQDCLQEMYSNHEDVEVGRCVQRFAGISCTWAFEMQAIFYHNSSGDAAFSDNLKRREVHRGITLHPIKDYRNMYRLHSYIQELKIQDLLYESLLVQRELLSVSMKNISSFGNLKAADSNKAIKAEELDRLYIYGLQPSLNKFQPRTESDILKWNFLGSKGLYSDEMLNPRVKIDGTMKEAIEDVVRDMMDIIHGFSRARGRVIEFKEILYGYHRVNPLYGEDFIMDLLLTFKKYRGKKATVPVRRHAYIQRPFAPLQLRLQPNNDNNNDNTRYNNDIGSKNTRVNENLVMILPLSGRSEALERFLSSFKQACISSVWYNNNVRNGRKKRKKDNYNANTNAYSLSLIIVNFRKEKDKENKMFHTLVNSFQKSTSNFHACQIKVVPVDNEEFSRSIALEVGISQCSDNDLLFLIDVDIKFNLESLERVTLNTVQGSQVYFPIVFSQYDPHFNYEKSPPSNTSKTNNNGINNKENVIEISDDIGYWRDYGFGIAAFYKSDFKRISGFDTSIKGWGKEDVSLYEQFISQSNELTIFRAPDPGLVHVYHEIQCDNQLSRTQYEMCLGTQANTLGSIRNLMKYIFKHRPTSGHNIKRFLEQAAMNNGL